MACADNKKTKNSSELINKILRLIGGQEGKKVDEISEEMGWKEEKTLKILRSLEKMGLIDITIDITPFGKSALEI